ncbi:RAP domain [Babesia duncani]|uniref:RAP domain n=1 Tax=Babesia duncani TaxID=323732 RepID=A0AAD9PK36_9APIC|nr:RAP domain [Babesia duncani]
MIWLKLAFLKYLVHSCTPTLEFNTLVKSGLNAHIFTNLVSNVFKMQLQRLGRCILNRSIRLGPFNGNALNIHLNRRFSSNSNADATAGDASKWMKKPSKEEFYFDADVEQLSPEQQKIKQELIRDLTKKLSGPLADEDGNVPTGDDRPVAIEVDGPSHFYANSTKYTAYTKLKHRILTRMGYKVLHVPFFEWRRLRGAKEREEYMRAKLKEEPTEWLDPDDEAFYKKKMATIEKETQQTAAALKGEN